MAGLALLAATGGAILDVSSTHAARAVETTVVDLVLPDLATMPDDLPGRARRVEGGGTRIEAPESFPARPAGSHMHLSAAGEDRGATHSPQSAAASPELDRGSVTGADIEVVPGASTGSSALADVATPANTGEPPVVAPAHRVTVSSGDSLYLIFKRLGLQQRDLALMTGLKPLAKKLARIAPRQEIEFYLDTESRLTRLVHRLDRLRSLHVFREGDAFEFEEVVEPPETAVATAAGVIDTSLFEAGQHAGLSDSLIMQMAEIFGWDVDFALDIRAGDRFALVFEEQFKDGEKVGEGPIVAAEFTNRGRRIRAVRYADPTGRTAYFSPDGRSMRKAFLRTPVNFTRISSRFSFSRRHPVLHKMRAHRGVDYAAPRGTAVKASGDGRVVFAGRNGGYGRTIVLRHGSVYTTLYAHLSRFSKGIRPGKRVEQGQTIGYVGSTGLATGPHLHYEFRVRGAHRDPLRVKLPQAAPLAEGYMDDFRSKAEPLLAKLDLTARTAIATAN
ncbi:MAG: peptidoglycan DD-metalloendopeptidase family protein [Chromatiales bacterium]|nr:peptidoglycan DD-metalloendopeptidase family protein [Chromatiales bacterium]